jgi:hypothetical protein
MSITDKVDTVVVRDIDPALKKLLDDLPLEDPDAPMATVWCPWCEGEHRVPVGVKVSLDFGKWYGPQMSTSDVPIYFSVFGQKGRVNLAGWNLFSISPTDNMYVENLVVTL